MFKQTLSTITTMLILSSGLNAEAYDKSVSVSVNPNADAKKGVIVVEATPQTTTTTTTQVQVPRPTAAQVVQPAKPSAGYGDTIMYASGAKQNYYVNEPIHIRLKLKRKAYIYFWTISANGNGYLILPNNLESFNDYRANLDYVVPERSADYDFVSDRAGVEQVYVLATNKKINPKQIEAIFAQKAGGVVPMASNKSIRQFVSKDIQVVARTHNLKYDIASFQVNVHDRQANNSTVNITVNQ